MARAHTACTQCEDRLWFDDDDPVPQHIICSCHTTELAESGPSGSFRALTPDEVSEIAAGIQRRDIVQMRELFDEDTTPRPRHSYRWNNQLGRWELSEVAPADRSLVAFRVPGDRQWTRV